MEVPFAIFIEKSVTITALTFNIVVIKY